VGTLRNAILVVAALGARAHADTDIQEADKLFAEGLALRDTNLQQSCDKFRQSFEKNPQAIGTLMNVALCDEKFGKIASAVNKFSEARDRAKEGNLPEYLEEAEKHINALTPDLPKVTVKFLAGKPNGTKVLIGELVLPMNQIDAGKPVAVDPGELAIVVSAPGRLAYETKMMIGKKEVKSIEVPELKKGVTVKSSRRTIGLITTISGGATVATSIVIGLFARNRYNDKEAIGACTNGVCPAEAQTKVENARQLGTVGTVVGAVGIVATGVGLYLWLTAPKESADRKVTLVPAVGPETAGLAAVGRF
jgi:hypothetical protein